SATAPTTRTVTPPPRATPKTALRTAPKPTTSNAAVSRPAPSRANLPPTATQVPTQNSVAQQQVVSQPPPIVVQHPVQTPVQEAPPPAAAPPPLPKPATIADIAPIVAAYARAIESGEIGAVRRVYPGITAFQQRNWETFFKLARNINVTLRIEDFQGSTSSAD